MMPHTRLSALLLCTLAIALFSLEIHAGESDTLVVIATGSNLDVSDFTGSDNNIQMVNAFIQNMRIRQPRLAFKSLPYFRLEDLQAVYDQEKQRPNPRKIVLVINAHGENQDGKYIILADDEWLDSRQIARIANLLPTETFFLTCHAGTADPTEFTGPIFGISPQEKPAWGNFLKKISELLIAFPATRFPLSAREMFVFVRNHFPEGEWRNHSWWGPTGLPDKPYEGLKTTGGSWQSADLPELVIPPPDHARFLARSRLFGDACKRLLNRRSSTPQRRSW